jgi:phosphatidate cytidylyltransferase
MVTVVIAVLFAGYSWSPFCITAFLGMLGVASVYELLHNVAKITKFPIIIIACIYAVVTIFVCKDSFANVLFCSILYCVIASIWVVLNYDDLNAEKVAFVYGMPIPFVIAFCALNMLVNNIGGLYYLILLFGFSSICDMGAYFVGSAIGRHKLCHKISPKKLLRVQLVELFAV